MSIFCPTPAFNCVISFLSYRPFLSCTHSQDELESPTEKHPGSPCTVDDDWSFHRSTELLLIGLLVWWTKIWKWDPGWKCDFANYLSPWLLAVSIGSDPEKSIRLIPSFLGIKVSLVSRGAADQNPDSEPSSAKRNTYWKGRYESSLSVRAFVQLPRSTLLSNELQMTFYSHNICWPLAAVTSLSSLHSVPPTVFISFFHSPPPGSRRILLWLIFFFS